MRAIIPMSPECMIAPATLSRAPSLAPHVKRNEWPHGTHGGIRIQTRSSWTRAIVAGTTTPAATVTSMTEPAGGVSISRRRASRVSGPACASRFRAGLRCSLPLLEWRPAMARNLAMGHRAHMARGRSPDRGIDVPRCVPTRARI